MKQTEIRSHIPALKVRSYAMDSETTKKTLDMLGIGCSAEALADISAYSKKFRFYSIGLQKRLRLLLRQEKSIRL